MGIGISDSDLTLENATHSYSYKISCDRREKKEACAQSLKATHTTPHPPHSTPLIVFVFSMYKEVKHLLTKYHHLFPVSKYHALLYPQLTTSLLFLSQILYVHILYL